MLNGTGARSRPAVRVALGAVCTSPSLPALPAALSSLLLVVQPAGALVLAAVFLGQRPALSQLAGAVLVCSAVLAVARTQVE